MDRDEISESVTDNHVTDYVQGSGWGCGANA
jgi:hypothetical protein